jgi:hypothetical protein
LKAELDELERKRAELYAEIEREASAHDLVYDDEGDDDAVAPQSAA